MKLADQLEQKKTSNVRVKNRIRKRVKIYEDPTLFHPGFE